MAGFISLRWMAHTLGQGPLEHTSHDATRIEVFLGQRARQTAVALVVGLHLGQGAHRLVHVPEPEEAVGIGQKAAGTRVLYHGRLPAGQIAGSAVADPTDRKSTRLNSSHSQISYAVFCLKKKKKKHE